MGDGSAPMSPMEWVLLAAVGGVVGNAAWVVCVLMYRGLANGAQAAAGRLTSYFSAPVTNLVVMPLVMLIGAAFVGAFLHLALLQQGVVGGLGALAGYIVRGFGVIKLPAIPMIVDLISIWGAWIVGAVIAAMGLLMQRASHVLERIPLRTPIVRAILAGIAALTVSIVFTLVAWPYVAGLFGAG